MGPPCLPDPLPTYPCCFGVESSAAGKGKVKKSGGLKSSGVRGDAALWSTGPVTDETPSRTKPTPQTYKAHSRSSVCASAGDTAPQVPRGAKCRALRGGHKPSSNRSAPLTFFTFESEGICRFAGISSTASAAFVTSLTRMRKSEGRPPRCGGAARGGGLPPPWRHRGRRQPSVRGSSCAGEDARLPAHPPLGARQEAAGGPAPFRR